MPFTFNCSGNLNQFTQPRRPMYQPMHQQIQDAPPPLPKPLPKPDYTSCASKADALDVPATWGAIGGAVGGASGGPLGTIAGAVSGAALGVAYQAHTDSVAMDACMKEIDKGIDEVVNRYKPKKLYHK